MAKEQNKSFVLRVDSETMDALERWAGDEFRSINGQLQWLIADALRRAGRLPRGARKDASPGRTESASRSKSSTPLKPSTDE